MRWRQSLRRGALLGTVALGCLVPAAASAPDPPSKVLQSILAAAGAQSSVHYTSTTDFGNEQLSFVGDAGLQDGSQSITYTKSGKTGHVVILLSGNTAYVRGDAFTLQSYMGFKPAPAQRYAGKWVRFPHTDAGFQTLAVGVTLPSVIEELALQGQLSRVPQAVVDGRQLMGVRSTDMSNGVTTIDTVYAAPQGSRLPVEDVATHGKTNLKIMFSNWNESIAIPAPNGSTAISVVRKAKSGGFVD
jgi:hypothetical protein